MKSSPTASGTILTIENETNENNHNRPRTPVLASSGITENGLLTSHNLTRSVDQDEDDPGIEERNSLTVDLPHAPRDPTSEERTPLLQTTRKN